MALIAIFALAAGVLVLGYQVVSLRVELKNFRKEYFDQELQTSKSLKEEMKNQTDSIRTSLGETAYAITMATSNIYGLCESNFEEMKKGTKPAKVLSEMRDLPPANRKPRTEEQKKAAAEKRKQWWEEKRKKEAEASLAASAPMPQHPQVGMETASV